MGEKIKQLSNQKQEDYNYSTKSDINITHGVILNIAAGKFNPIKINFDKYLLINIDTMYFEGEDFQTIERVYNSKSKLKSEMIFGNGDIFEFMERTKIMFDQICVYRFLEHISKDLVSYFIYLISTCTKPGAIIDVIVPNYETLAKMILNEQIEGNLNFEKHNILLTTELLNEKTDPHCSIWTNKRLEYYWTLESKFEIKYINSNYNFDGRDIYLRMIAQRI